jgi:peroxiredoxin
MAVAVVTARVLLAAVFVVAGLAKLADRAGSRQAVEDFGVPAVLAAPVAVLLPAAELAVAVAVLPRVSAWWGALGALGLLLLFAAGIAVNLARGHHPDCHCFGQLHSAPAGWPTLLRNLGLAAVAGLVVVVGQQTPGPSVVGWFTALPAAERVAVAGGVAVTALLAGGGWVLTLMMTQQGRLLLRIEALETAVAATDRAPGLAVAGDAAVPAAGLPVGVPAPGFRLPDLAGGVTGLESLRSAGKPVVLVFSDPGCGPCTALLPEIGRWQREFAAAVVVALISRGPVDAVRAKAGERGLSHVLVQKDREVARAYEAHGTPSAVLVNRDGTVGSPLAQGIDAVRALVASTVNLPVRGAVPVVAAANGNGHGPARPAGARRGEFAPNFALPGLAGETVRLSDFRGSPVLVLFWNPGCGFCQRMLTDLRAWDADPPAGAPRLLVVSSGTVADNQALGLDAPVLLDNDGMNIAGRFGATGTPMAVLVAADGTIASPLAAGAPAVFALAGAGTAPPASLPLVARPG